MKRRTYRGQGIYPVFGCRQSIQPSGRGFERKACVKVPGDRFLPLDVPCHDDFEESFRQKLTDENNIAMGTELRKAVRDPSASVMSVAAKAASDHRSTLREAEAAAAGRAADC